MAYIERIVMNTELPITIVPGQFHRIVKDESEIAIEVSSRRVKGFECYDKPITYRCYSAPVVCIMA